MAKKQRYKPEPKSKSQVALQQPQQPETMQPQEEDRLTIMQRDVLLVATAGASLLNGQAFSPLYWSFDYFLKPFIAPWTSSQLITFYLSSLIISLLTLMLAGVPAAIYERFRGLKDTTPMSLGIWFIGTLILSIPAFRGLFGYV